MPKFEKKSMKREKDSSSDSDSGPDDKGPAKKSKPAAQAATASEYSAAVKLEPKDDENVSDSYPEKSRLVANRDYARSSRQNVEAQSDPKIEKASQINNPSDINLDTSIKLEENELDLSLDYIPFFGTEPNFKHENSNQIKDIGTFCSKSAQGSESNGSCHKEKAFQASLEPVLDDLEDPTVSIEIHHCQGAISRIENKNEIIQDQNQDFSFGTYKSEKESALNRMSVGTSSKGRGRGHGTRSKIKGGRGRPRGPTLGSHGSKIRFEDSFQTPEFNSANIQLQTTPEVPNSDQQIAGTSLSFFGKRGGMRGRKRATSQNKITSDSLIDPSVRAKGRQRGNRVREHAISQTELAGASLINPSVTCRVRGKRNRNTCVSQNEIFDNNCSQSRKRQRKETKSLPENASDNEIDTNCKGPKKRRVGKKKQHNKSGGSSTPGSALPGNEPSWLLGNMKFVKVREFKGQTYIDIREYYTDKKTMDMMPGKKGISLNCEQYQKLKATIAEIDRALP